MGGTLSLRVSLWWMTAAALLLPIPLLAQSTQPAFVAPPRTIADITAILDQEKPDPAKRAKTESDAEAKPPAGNPSALGQFYYRRAQARATLGRVNEAIADCLKAIESGGDYVNEVSRYEQYLESQYRSAGDFKKAIELSQRRARRFEEIPHNKGRLFNIYLQLVLAYINVGDLNRAGAAVNKLGALQKESYSWPNVEKFRSSWEADVENGKARLFEARGQYREAEPAYRKSESLLRDAMSKSQTWPHAAPKSQFERGIDYLIAFQGRSKSRQGRLAEAEVDIRRALLSRLKSVGKYNPDTAEMSLFLANLLVEQTRYAEAEKLARSAVEIHQTLGYPGDSQVVVVSLAQLASTLYSQRKFDDAGEIYAKIDAAISKWETTRSARFRLGWARIFNSYYTRNVNKGLELAREFQTHEIARAGEKHFDSAMAHAILGTGLTFAQIDSEAAQEFKLASPILLTSTREEDSDDATVTLAADRRMQVVMEAYMTLLARSANPKAAEDSFLIAERIRGRSVEKALAASGARAASRDPALAKLARKEQDFEKQIGAQLGAINNFLSLSPEQRDDRAIHDLHAKVGKLRGARTGAKRDIERRFPNYANLIAPRPAAVEEIRAALKGDEAFLSFYLGRQSSFVWAIPKAGPIAFAAIPVTAGEIEKKVVKLREALEPQATTLDDIPQFDLALAHELYSLLLKPVEAGWLGAKNIIMVTNGALGLLPLGLLPTASAQIDQNAEPLFADYRKVPWLARTHAVTLVPSAAALRALRQLPPGSNKREPLVGFGDPLFNKEQAADVAQADASIQVAAAGTTTRGLPLKRRTAPQTRGMDSAQLRLIPRLPDTADELKSIALALQADPSKVLNLGKAANEETVKKTDLSKFRIIVFATHGLVPGDLDGLHQPALALTAPEVAGVPGDGLLTMEEILALKLNADWVVLSACNTGAGAGAGAEAASGLGRAFFYAGTRAILVTNWSVHSAAARELVTDLFRRQAADLKLSRGEALRQATMTLLDGPGYTDASGKSLFTYGHPIFWVPYTIIGDGGGS